MSARAPSSSLPSVVSLPLLRSIGGCLLIEGERVVEEESSVALIVNGARRAVMMATPADLQDLAIGFCLSEAIITRPEQVTEFAIAAIETGIELRMAVTTRDRDVPPGRKSHRSARSGSPAPRTPVPSVPVSLLRKRVQISASMIEAAVAALDAARSLNHGLTGLHAAAFWRPDRGLVAAREDIGRVNALDKLVGALTRAQAQVHDGIVLSSGRACAEIVQKMVPLGAQFIIAIGGPTTLAVRIAEKYGITLIAFAHDGDFAVFSHADRIAGFASAVVARDYAFIEAAARITRPIPTSIWEMPSVE